MSPPHLGIFLAKNMSSAFSRKSRIHAGSFFISEIWLTISASSPLRARNTGFESVWKSYLLISPIGSAEIAGVRISVAMFYLPAALRRRLSQLLLFRAFVGSLLRRRDTSVGCGHSRGYVVLLP